MNLACPECRKWGILSTMKQIRSSKSYECPKCGHTEFKGRMDRSFTYKWNHNPNDKYDNNKFKVILR